MNLKTALLLCCLILLTLAQTAQAATPMVAAGLEFSLALKSDGGVVAWGRNDHGQLGNGQAALRSTPAKVVGIDHVVSVVAGFGMTFALRDDGTLWGWGLNGNGALGDGTTLSKSHPVAVKGINGRVTAFASTMSHALALTSDGGLWAWGWGLYGQLGDGTNGQVTTPIKIPGLPTVQAVATGDYHSLALGTDGSVWAWGDNSLGQLGDGGGAQQRTTPARIAALANIVAISSYAYINLALDASGRVWSWGNGGWGAVNSLTPALVSGLPKITSIIAGNAVSLGIASDGSVWMWGGNDFGQFGDPQYGRQLSPVKVSALTGFSGISVGGNHVIGRNPAGILQSWGQSFYGQLGFGDTADRPTPTTIPGLPTIKQVSGGKNHSAAVAADGSVWTWGSNGTGELGDGTVAISPLPVAVQLSSQTTAIATGLFHALALSSDGSVRAWGSNPNGELGDGTQRDNAVPQRTLGLPVVTAIAAGNGFSLALDGDGAVWSWGNPTSSGRLGNGKVYGAYPTPQKLSAITGVTRLSAGTGHALVLRSNGSVWAWGDNFYGQIGDGTTTNRSTPTAVPGLTNITAVAAGAFHSLALDATGKVWAWGYNYDGDLGDGTYTNKSTPAPVANLTNVIAIAAGENTSYALTADGRLWAWGWNREGRLGAGSVNWAEPYAALIAGVTGFQSISASQAGSPVALRADGSVWSWGRNLEGQLGDGTMAQRPTPELVLNSTGDNFLDLNPLAAKTLPGAKIPAFVMNVKRPTDTDTQALVRYDAQTQGKTGNVYVVGYLKANSRLLMNSSGFSATNAGVVPVVLTRGGFKQMGGGATDAAYSGPLDGKNNTFTLYNPDNFDSTSEFGVLCTGYATGVGTPSAKGLIRPAATGQVSGAYVCPPIQLNATSSFVGNSNDRSESLTLSGTITPKTEDVGKPMNIYTWAVAPDGRFYVKKGANWEVMSALQLDTHFATTLTANVAAPIVENLDLRSLAGTHAYVGYGASDKDMLDNNRYGLVYTIK